MKQTARSLRITVLVAAMATAVVGVAATPAFAQPGHVKTVACDTEPC